MGEVLNIARQSLRRPASEETRQEADDLRLGAALSQHVKRRWKAGDLYAPHDLSPEETQKYKRKKAPQYDIFDVLEMNPLDEYKVPNSFCQSFQLLQMLIVSRTFQS